MKRISTRQSVLLLIALLGGVVCALIDDQPSWVASGVLMFGILPLSSMVCLLGFRRPWLAALCVGVWIPLHAIIFTHNFEALIALAFAFLGSYAGWGLNKLSRMGTI